MQESDRKFISLITQLGIENTVIQTVSKLFWNAGIRQAMKIDTQFPRLEVPKYEAESKVTLSAGDASALTHVIADEINTLIDTKLKLQNSLDRFYIRNRIRNRISRLTERIARLEELQIKLKKISRSNG